MSMKTLTIHSIFSRYQVVFDENLRTLSPMFQELNTVFLIDEKVYNLYSEIFHDISPERLILIKANERNKSYFSIAKIYEKLIVFQAKRNLTLIGIGGGIIQDISGFIASTLCRGIKWLYCPTTLLAQADSCIGAKTSLNFGNYKNLIGTFYSPEKIILSTRFLTTLSRKDFYSGMGEIIKLFLIDGEDSLNYFNSIPSNNDTDFRNNIVGLLKRSLMIKKRFIEKDEFDKGIRNILNFGHCIGHAIESVTNYAIPHGQAVTLGIIWANIISEKKNFLLKEKKEMIYNTLLKNSHTITKKWISFDSNLIISAMKKDKKRVGENLAIILLNENNTFSLVKDLKEDLIIKTYDEFTSLFH
jgi:3-dehydroquinate synthase